jgi:hypothetical protein
LGISAPTTKKRAKPEHSEQTERPAFMGRSCGRCAAKNARTFDRDTIRFASLRVFRACSGTAIGVHETSDTSEHSLVTYALFTFVILGATDTLARRFVAEQAARTIGIGLTNVRRGDDANVGICGRIADIASETIGVLVAYALLAGVITMAAPAFRIVRTRFAQFFGAEDIAAIAGRHIAIVATFVGFEDAVATSSWNASIGIGCGIAEFAALAIRILIASANLNIAQTARAR